MTPAPGYKQLPDPDTEPELPDHLTRTRPAPAVANAGRPSEVYCRECRRRVTIGHREYGHGVDCGHAIGVEAADGDGREA